jgi:protein-tyrosine phosphatase
MIDLHSHIIPAVDDGSSSLEESLEMLEAAWKDGVKAIVATPHMFGPVGRIKTIEHLQRTTRELKKTAADFNLKIEILAGAEIFFVSDLREKLETYRDALTINNSGCFLLEFPPDLVFPGSGEYIGELVARGLIPIICHPERNDVFQDNPRLLYRLLQAGALSQVDAGSLRGEFGPEAYSSAMLFFKCNLVHVVASDCHGMKSRLPGLSFVYKKLAGLGKEKIDMLVEKIPLAIVNKNALPDMGPMLEPGKRRSVFDFLRGGFRFK